MYQNNLGRIPGPSSVTRRCDHVLARWVDICGESCSLRGMAYILTDQTILTDFRDGTAMMTSDDTKRNSRFALLHVTFWIPEFGRIPQPNTVDRCTAVRSRNMSCVPSSRHRAHAHQAMCLPSGNAATALTHCDVAGWRKVLNRFGVSVVPLVPPFRTSQTSNEAFRRPAMT